MYVCMPGRLDQHNNFKGSVKTIVIHITVK